MNKKVYRTFGTQVSRLVPALVQASFVLVFTLFSSPIFSQVVPDGYYVDGYGFPFGNGGYAVDGVTEVNYTNDIVPEINNLYPDNPTTNPDRMCNASCGADDGYFDGGGVGEYRVSTKGIHGGDDANDAAGNAGKPVLAVANGQVVAIFSVNLNYCEWGWLIVMKHYHTDGTFYHSVYKHVTTANNVTGTICDGPEDFTVAVGDWVMRGDTIARMGADYCIATNHSHLHFEIRNSNLNFPFNGTMNDLYPRDNGRQAYGGVYCPVGCASSGLESGGITAAETANAYLNMQLDGIEDAWNFVASHRPSTFETVCGAEEPTSYGIQWQNTLGGSNYEVLHAIDKTSDGGFILGGTSNSVASGDKTETGFGQEDYWIVKIDECGNREWDRTYGGDQYDQLMGIMQTPEGGYIIGGYSWSGATGNKSQEQKGGGDYWIIKTDNLGNIIRQQVIGGTGSDVLKTIKITSDGGYILAGESTSNANGDKNENCKGGTDYWIVKLNDTLGIQWQNTLGGSSYEVLGSVEETSDGGYLVTGSSVSYASPDKSEDNLGGVGITTYDMWLVKLDVTGLITQWENTIGGDNNDWAINAYQLSDGGYIIGGSSQSAISDDITESPVGGSGNYAYLLMKLNASGDTIVWQNMIGGTNIDVVKNMIVTSDGGYLLTGVSYSSISGDKTVDNFDYLNGDIWIVKTNSSGMITNQNVFGGSDSEADVYVVESSDDGYLLGIVSPSPVSGNKTEASALYDFWAVKIFGCIPTVEICNSIDDDCDGSVDEGLSVSVSTEAFGPVTFCQGSSVVLGATYTGTSVQWYKNGVTIAGATSSTLNVNTSGSYTCKTSNACVDATSSAIVITVYNNPNASITAGGPTTFCPGGSVTLTEAPAAGCTYQWYKGANPITGATSTTYVATVSGNFKCRVTKAATGCYKNSNVISVTVSCREGEIVEGSLYIFPNPSSGVVNIRLDEGIIASVIVTNMLGEEVMSESVDANQATLDLSNLPKGSYLLTVFDGLFVHSELIIVE